MNKKLKGEKMARQLVKYNQPIPAIRHLRFLNPGLSLKEAKDVVDGWRESLIKPIDRKAKIQAWACRHNLNEHGRAYPELCDAFEDAATLFQNPEIAASSPKQNWAELEKKINSAPDWMKDKERLDWLDEKSTHWSSGNGGMYTFHAPLDSQDIRAAIDAAMRKEKKP
jgi:hypothetical protein